MMLPNPDITGYFFEDINYENNTFVCQLLKEIIKKDFDKDSKHALCIIKKIIIGYLHNPGGDIGIGFRTFNLLKQLIKNTTPSEEIIIKDERLVKRTLSISCECIEWIIMEVINCLNTNNDKKVKKTLALLCLLIQHNLVLPNNIKLDSIIKKAVLWLEWSKNFDRSSDPWILWPCIEAITTLIKEGIGEKILQFLEVSHILNFPEILQAVVEYKILTIDSAFGNSLIEKTIKLLDDNNPDSIIRILTILSDNSLLSYYPEYHEVIASHAVDWLQDEQSVQQLLLMQSLIINKIFVFQPKRIEIILKALISCINKEESYLSRLSRLQQCKEKSYAYRLALSIIDESQELYEAFHGLETHDAVYARYTMGCK